MELPVWQAVLLGVLQGLTEFLPISSSGHLAIVQHYLPAFEQPGVLFDVSLHIGTLAAVIVYYASDLKILASNILGKHGSRDIGWRLLGGILLATVATCAVGWYVEPRIEALFQSMRSVAAGLLVTAVLLLLADFKMKQELKNKPQDPGILQSILIGLAQGIALVPGISRSGATIVAGIAAGVERERAVRFSFLIFMPAVIIALLYTAIKQAEHISGFGAAQVLVYLIGAAVAMAVGYACLGLLVKVVEKGRLSYFAIYCAIMGVTIIFLNG